MMHMTFYWGRRVTILFDSWRTDSWTSYFLSLLACFLISIFYQYLEDRRLRFNLLSNTKTSPIQTPLIVSRLKGNGGRWAPSRILTAFMFCVNSAIGYMLMLAVMSFNGGVFIAIVVGLGFGYLVFRGGDADEGVVVVDNPCACA